MKTREKIIRVGTIAAYMLIIFSHSACGQTDPTERISANAESLNDVIYVMAGMTLSQSLSTVSAYIPAKNIWESKTAMPTPRAGAGSAVLEDIIYVVGGRNENSVVGTLEKYQTREDKWVSIKPMSTPRWSLMAAGVDGKVYAFGGISGVGNNRKTLDTIEVYHPDKDTWEMAGRMPQPRHSAAIAVVGSRIYIISGKIASYTEVASGEPITERVDCFDLVSSTWREVKPIPTGRTGARAVVFNERIYVVGGIAKNNEFPVTIDVYNPKSDQWEVGPNLKKGRSGHACAVLDNTLYIIGGSAVRYGSGTPTICKGLETLALP
jgi:N-acetylneuraminic acid mutarotase